MRLPVGVYIAVWVAPEEVHCSLRSCQQSMGLDPPPNPGQENARIGVRRPRASAGRPGTDRIMVESRPGWNVAADGSSRARTRSSADNLKSRLHPIVTEECEKSCPTSAKLRGNCAANQWEIQHARPNSSPSGHSARRGHDTSSCPPVVRLRVILQSCRDQGAAASRGRAGQHKTPSAGSAGGNRAPEQTSRKCAECGTAARSDPHSADQSAGARRRPATRDCCQPERR